MKRLLYGAFFEKKWRVLLCKDVEFDPVALGDGVISTSAGSVVPVDPTYTFYADPFFSASGDEIYLEAMNRLTGKGDILSIDVADLKCKRRILTSRHFSYPHPVAFEGQEYLLPETAEFTSPKLFPLTVNTVPEGTRELRGLEGRHLYDVTPFFYRGSHYLFASEPGSSEDNLQVFFSEHILGPYVKHPMNPVVIDPCRARMAGAILTAGERIFRLGQDYSRDYGDGITVCEILELTRSAYREVPLRNVRLADARGPHTINLHGVNLVLDYYVDIFSPLAGYRRLMALFTSIEGRRSR